MPQYSTMVPRTPLTYRNLVGICFLLFLTSCVSTYLDGPPIGTDYTRLAALGKRNLVVAVNTAAEEITVGHQWVFLVAPVGTIKLHNSHQVLSAALFRNLAERGYRPKILPPDGENGGSPDITITDLELACAVPDLFFVRRVNCSVVLHGFSGRARAARGDRRQTCASRVGAALEPAFGRSGGASSRCGLPGAKHLWV